MKQRILILLLALVMLVSIFPAAAYADEVSMDTDYDGIPDEIDNDPNNNAFTGTYNSGDFTINMRYTMDYRNFFGENTVYNEQIAGFSVWAAQFCYENEDGSTKFTPLATLYDNGSALSEVTHIDQLMRVHGMENVIDYRLKDGYFTDGLSLGAYADDDITEVFIGHHKVTFNGETIDVIAAFVRGTNGTEKEWCSNFDVGDLHRYEDDYDCVEGKSPRQVNGDWNRKSNHRGFDVSSTRVRRALEAYVDAYVDPDVTPVYWFTGHSRGGAIANILSSYYVDAGKKVFAYTFASPNTTANTEASAAKYDCIFNLVNGDDFVPMLPMPEWGFTRYGRTATYKASSVSSTDRKNLLTKTGYTYSTDLQTLTNKFVNMTKNNAGGNDGWRDIYVYHCQNAGSSTASYHQHEGETVGEYRSDSWKDFYTDSNWNGYNEHTKKYSYCVKDNNGWINKYACCQTPAYAMQILAITMGNLGLSAGWDFLTSYKLADRFDFGKTSLITSYATKIIDPHYMENYYLIQTVLERDKDPEAEFNTNNSLYAANGRPVHEHSYTWYAYEGHEQTCTEEGLGYKLCECSAVDGSYYDDVIKNVSAPALGHDFGEWIVTTTPSCTELGEETRYCSRCDETETRALDATGHDWGEVEYTWSEDNATCTATVVCLNDSSHVETETVNTSYEVVTPATTEDAGLGRYTAAFENELFAEQTAEIELAQHRAITVYVVDETDSAQLNAWVWGAAGDLFDAWPGEALTQAGTDKGGHPYYSIRLDATDYGTAIIFNHGSNIQTGNLNYVADAGENDYVVYYIYGQDVNDLKASKGDDLWPDDEAHAAVTAPTCEEGGFTTFTGMFTGETRIDAHTPALGHDWAEPTYVWAEDYASCTATRVCKNDAAHVETETVNAVVNAASYTATFENPAFAAQTKEAIGVTGHNLGLEGAILVNTFIHVPEEYLDGKAVLSYTGLNDVPVTKEVPLSNAALRPVTVNGETIESRTIAIAMPAKNMNTVVTIRLYDAAGNPLKMLCAGALVDSHEYSIQSYLQQVIDNSEAFEAAYPGITELCKVMSDYGSYAQLALDFETDNRKPINYESEVAAVAVSGYDYSTEVGGSGVSYYGASVLLRSETTIRAYFKITGSGSYTASYTDGAQTYTAELVHYKEGSKYYYVDIPNISARRLGEKFTITVKDSSNEENFASLVNYSAYGYAQKVLSSSDDANLKLAVKALYRYGEVAKAFLERLNNG